MSPAKLYTRLVALAMFVWDFVVGDDWTLALGVAAGLGGTALLVGSDVIAWWLLPAVAGLLLTLSVWRVSEPGRSSQPRGPQR